MFMGLTTHGLGEESWVWTDGSTFDFFDWGNKQPFNYSGEEDCGVFWPSDLSWHDMSCNELLNFVCVK